MMSLIIDQSLILDFCLKRIERIVAKNLFNHLANKNLLPVCQSGFRKFHSAETALTDIVSTLFAAIDNKNVSIMALLDMSAAFDRVDHRILLDRLSHCFCVKGVVNLWFEAY